MFMHPGFPDLTPFMSVQSEVPRANFSVKDLCELGDWNAEDKYGGTHHDPGQVVLSQRYSVQTLQTPKSYKRITLALRGRRQDVKFPNSLIGFIYYFHVCKG
jgi:hypothetical protein